MFGVLKRAVPLSTQNIYFDWEIRNYALLSGGLNSDRACDKSFQQATYAGSSIHIYGVQCLIW